MFVFIGGEFMNLTQKQQDVYDVILSYVELHHYSPTVRDICMLTGLKSPSTAHGYMGRLKKLGVIDWEPEKPRTLKIVR
jgi:repressor LexA